MIIFNKSDFDKLKPYEKYLKQAYYGKFVSALRKEEIDFLFNEYNRIFNKNEKSTNCGSCKVRVIGLLGKYYFDYENKIKEKMEKARDAKRSKTNA